MDNVNLTIRIPPDLLDQLRARAKQEDRTLASLIRVLLAQAVQMPDLSLRRGEYVLRAEATRTMRPVVEEWNVANRDMPMRMDGETDEAWKARVMEAGQR